MIVVGVLPTLKAGCFLALASYARIFSRDHPSTPDQTRPFDQLYPLLNRARIVQGDGFPLELKPEGCPLRLLVTSSQDLRVC
jgi:hypothetical protein